MFDNNDLISMLHLLKMELESAVYDLEMLKHRPFVRTKVEEAKQRIQIFNSLSDVVKHVNRNRTYIRDNISKAMFKIDSALEQDLIQLLDTIHGNLSIIKEFIQTTKDEKVKNQCIFIYRGTRKSLASLGETYNRFAELQGHKHIDFLK